MVRVRMLKLQETLDDRGLFDLLDAAIQQFGRFELALYGQDTDDA